MTNGNSEKEVLKEKILVIDDEPQVTQFLAEIVARQGFEPRISGNGHDALEIAVAEPCAVAIVDIMMPGLGGMETIRRLKEVDADLEVIVFTGYPSIDSSIEAIEQRVFGYLTKPSDRHVIVRMVERAAERRRLILENRRLMATLERERDHLRDEVTAAKRGIERRLEASDALIGKSKGICEVRHFIAQVAPTDLAVLILGESGVGKDVVARLIHESSGRDPNAFIKINCPTIPEALLESELFGHEPGAFTGATKSKPGRFKLASGGTVFLDEIGDLPLNLQAKLLQAIEDKCFTPLGGTEAVKVDFRIIAATNAPIKTLIAESRFRSDLFYRLNDYAIHLPPLRRRKEDIPLLAEHFLSVYGKKFKRPAMDLSPAVLSFLTKEDWPGNVRELESFIRRFVLEDGSKTTLERLQREADAKPAPAKVAEKVRQTEKDAILTALAEARWNRRRAAELLGISYSSLRRRISKYNLAMP